MPAKAARHKQQKKKSTPKRNPKTKASEKAARPNWVDTIQWETVGENASDDVSLSILSWNVLANHYCRRHSQRQLPTVYQRCVFDVPHRVSKILLILQQPFVQQADVICLQEVDQEEIRQLLTEQGYQALETPIVEAGNPGGKVDACGLYVKRATWDIVDTTVFHCDNLGLLAEKSNSITSSDSRNIQGLQGSFLRHNVAICARLQHKESKQTIVLVNAHLFWNPNFEYVKLCQAHYILQQTIKYRKSNEPVVFCGDLNSRPGGVTHQYLSRGSVNAKRHAPWYATQHREDDSDDDDGIVDNNSNIVDRLADAVQEKIHLNGHNKEPWKTEIPQVRYLLDASLNKFCRWLRILGLDVALETEEEEKKRTSDADLIIFDRCRQERRTLVTTSPRLMERKECPASAYCVSPPFLSSSERLEVAMIHMLRTHDVVLDPTLFLSRCVVCNGCIQEVEEDKDKRQKLIEYEAPLDLIDNGMAVYECDGCRQGYWWCDRPTSSASRVKLAATKLFELCIRGGVKVKTTDMGMFQDVNVERLKKLGWDDTVPGSELLHQQLDAVEWLKSERLQCPVALESAYANNDKNDRYIGESIPFTNVTNDFVSTLDYIYFDVNRFQVSERLYVPRTFLELSNGRTVRNAHVLPSDVWPSDHLAIGCRLSLKQFHPPRCDCGCVPSIPSLFEMAQLREAARKKKQSEP